MSQDIQSRQKLGLEPISFLDAHVSLKFPLRFRYIVEAYEVKQKMDRILLAEAVRYIFDFHDLLRLHLLKAQSMMRLFITNTLPEEPVLWINIAKLSDEEQQNIIHNTMSDIYRSLENSDGFLCRFIYFNLGERGGDIFLMIVHHILADGYTMQILSQDIQQAYLQLCSNKAPQLTPKTASFNDFAGRIKEYLYLEFPYELDYWHSLRTKTNPFFVDYPENRIIDSTTGETNVQFSEPRSIALSLSEEETRGLLNTVLIAKSRVEDVLLSGLVQVVTPWLGESGVHVYTINNGRTLFDNIDVSHTVGYIALGSWQYFHSDPNLSPGELLKSVTEQRNHIPHKGIGLSLAVNYSEHKDPNWSQFCPSKDVGVLKDIYFSDNIMFNYLGREFSSSPKKGLFYRADSKYQKLIASTDLVDPPQILQKPCKLNSITIIRNNKLILTWEYDGALYRTSTIESLAKAHLNAIKTIISYYVS